MDSEKGSMDSFAFFSLAVSLNPLTVSLNPLLKSLAAVLAHGLLRWPAGLMSPGLLGIACWLLGSWTNGLWIQGNGL